MKKKITVIVSIIVLALIITLALCFLVFNKKDNSDRVLSLGALKYKGEYQYAGLEWGLSSSQVKRKLPFSIAERTEIEPLNEHYTIYKSESLFTLDGSSSVATFEFYDDKLQMISFDFQLDDNYMEWFEGQVAGLTDLYGAATKKTENSSDKSNIIGYIWNTDTTTLQMFLVASGENATIRIGISLRPPYYQV